MNEIKKQKIREWFKKHKKIMIGSGAFLIVGLISFFIGFGIAYGWDYIPKMLTQPYAVTIYIIIFIALCILGLIFYFEFIKKKGGE